MTHYRERVELATQLERDLGERDQTIGQLHDEVDMQKRANVALKQGVDSLRQYKRFAEEKLSLLKSRIRELENPEPTASEITTVPQAEVDELLASRDQRIAELESELQQVADAADGEDQITALQDQLKEREVSLQSLTARLEERESAATRLQSALDKRKEESVQSAAAAEELHARVLAGEERAATLESNLKAGQELIESLQQDLRNLPELERRLAASEEELERLSGERESKNELIESLQNDVRDLTRARKRMREQDAEISRVRTELEQEKQALSNAQTELAELRSGHADANLAEKLEEKEKAINVLSGALRNRDSAVATLTRKIDDLKQQYADLENQYVSTNPTMPSLTAIPDKGAGSGGRD